LEDATRYQHGTFQSVSVRYPIERSAISLNMLSVGFSICLIVM
jgi:hypothetical protein